ncbi:uncharacterized protein LOC115692520 [Syzygium oleosum]|uniref:uncharacterized protein LOC115692520 n=1 Tax=Syzygium oleosum TaxID=219896 RepID=UPI0024BAD2EE|nr:uncharacterized protein LOC115692520 [Syzygium oleosum]
MPGNGVGDRDNHFFGQESLSQGHSRLDVVDRTWPGLSNNLLVGSQRQSGFPFIPDLKNYSVHQSDIDARHGSPFHMTHGLSFGQTNMQPELSGSQFHSLQTSFNGYIQGHQFFPAAQNEANFLGMDTESDQHSLGSKGFPFLDSQRVRGMDLHKRDPVKSLNVEAPVSFHFSTRQEQMGGQHLSAMQSFHEQQNSISDMQLLQQQVMLKQLQDVQRQMLQQQENWNKSSASQLSAMAKPALASHPSMQLNGIPVNDASSYSWQSGLTENTSWVPRGASPVLQGSSGGLVLSPEQVQRPHVMGLVPQQVDQSIYEVSHSGSKENLSQISQMEIDDIALQQIASNVHSYPGSLYSSLPDQGSVQDVHLFSKQFEDVGHGLSSGFNLGTSQQVNSPQGNVSLEEFDGSQEFAHLSEAPQGKTSSSVASSQSVGTLDPTEERILFGADDSVWGAFGGGTGILAGNYSMGDGTGSLSGFPSVQSGSWSALMQSALAETSSDNQIVQEEWSGLSVQSAQPSISNQKPLSENESARQQLAWGDDTLHTSLLSSRSVQLADNVVKSGGFPSVSGFQQSDLRALHGQNENVKTASSGRSEILQADSPRIIHDFSDGNRWLERSHLQRNSSEGSQICGNIANSSDAEGKRIMGGSWSVQQSMSSSIPGDQQNNRTSCWNVIESAMPGDYAVSNNYSRNTLLSFQNVSHNRSLHEQVSHEVAVSNADSVPTDGLEHAKLIDRQNSTLSNASISTLTTRRSQGESIQPLPRTHGFDFWRPVDSSMNTKESEVQGSNRNNMDRSVQTMQSLGINRMYERENLNGKENLASGFHLNASLHRPTGIFREHEWSNADELGNLRESKQNLFGQGAQKPTGIHKFQYHPMGNLNVDMESPYGANHFSLSRAMPQQVSGAIRSPGQGHIASSNTVVQTDKSSAGMEKVDVKGAEATLPGILVTSNNLSSLQRSLVSPPSNENALSSQKMLEHLHKVDQSREHGAASHLSSSDLNETNEAENSDGSISQAQRNQYPQTASSWFEQYRTLKNSQVMQVYDARQMANVKAMQQPVIAQKPADGLQHPNLVAQVHSAFLAGPLSNICSSTTPAGEHMSLHHSSPPNAMPPKLLVKPKKRKSTISGPLAWHKEVAEGARRLHDPSMAEEEWAAATNMLVEKVGHESDPNELVLPAHTPKRRLLLTTQLMQLLFQPPPAAFLTADSSSRYEDIAYSVGRLTLGNTCSIISCPNSEKTLSRMPESERTDDGSFSKSVDELVGRIKNLETELSRLGKRVSMVDLRVECQDLERFSVINRFAKFHCRGQATNGTGTSSSDSGAGAQKVLVQRYVTALPMPKSIPDGVQCLTL